MPGDGGVLLEGEVTVLIADDESSVRDVTSEVLGDAGYKVIVARDGADAIRKAKADGGPIHVLVSDVVMPKIGGPELAHRLRADYPKLGVLFVSGSAQGIPMGGYDVVRYSVLEKPFTMAELKDAVRRLIDEID